MNQDILDNIYDITLEKLECIVKLIIENSDMKSDFQILVFFNSILKCSSYRPEKINELANLIKSIYLYFKTQNQNNMLNKLQDLFLSIIFREYQNDISIEEKTYLMAFLYKLYEISFFDDFSKIFNFFQKFSSDENESFQNFQFLFFIWFLPEINEFSPSYTINKLNDLANFVKSSDCSPLLFTIESNIQKLQIGNWGMLKEIREKCYNYNFYIDKNINNVDDQILIEKVEPSIFNICPFLQYRPTVSMVDAFFQSARFDEKKTEYDFSMIDDNDFLFNYFIAASGSIPNIQYIQSKNIKLNGTLHIAALFHRNDLFEYLHNSLTSNDPKSVLTERIWRIGTVLHQAAISDNVKILEFCLSKGVDITSLTDDEGKLLIHYATQYNSLEIIRKIESHFFKNPISVINLEDPLFKKFSSFINSTDDNGMTPLMYAAANNSIEVVHFLLKISDYYKLVIDVNSKDITGKSALHYAAKTGASEIISELLQFDGINVNPLDNSLRLPSHFAAHYGHPLAIETLLANRSSVDKESKNGWTPIKSAIACGHKKCVIILLRSIALDKKAQDDLFNFSEEKEQHEIAKLISK